MAIRYERCSIKIEKDIRAELDEIAKSYGLYTSTLAAFIIGQWVTNEKNKKRESCLAVPAEKHAPGFLG